MDVHVKRAVTDGLRRRGVDVLTAQEDGTNRLHDSDLLDHATSLGRVLFRSGFAGVRLGFRFSMG
jgi:hypothetical protein